MLTSADVKKDLKEFLGLKDYVKEPFKYAVIKGIRLAVRLLLSVRVNQVRMMKKIGVELIEGKQKDGDKDVHELGKEDVVTRKKDKDE